MTPNEWKTKKSYVLKLVDDNPDIPSTTHTHIELIA